MRSRSALMSAVLAAAAFAGGAAQVLRREIESFVTDNPGRKKAPRKARGRWRALQRAATFEKTHFSKTYGERRVLWFRKPHSPDGPRFMAIAYKDDRKRYFPCRSYEEALSHTPFVIEHLNGFGQVRYRENFVRPARAADTIEAVSGILAQEVTQ